MLAKMFSRAVEASFHRGDTCVESFGDLRMAAALLDQRQQGAILRPELRQRVAQCIELLGINRPRRLRNIFVLLTEGEKNTAQLLPAQLIDARVAREAKQPRLELRGGLQTIESANHFNEHLLRQILHVIASARHGIDEARNPMLIADDELTLGGLVAPLSPADEVSQRIR